MHSLLFRLDASTVAVGACISEKGESYLKKKIPKNDNLQKARQNREALEHEQRMHAGSGGLLAGSERPVVRTLAVVIVFQAHVI